MRLFLILADGKEDLGDKMKIVSARHMGFCPGVKRAWGLVSREAGENVYILGELIHNKQAMEKLGEWGIKTINSLDEIKDKGTVMIRAHGEPPQTFQKLKKSKLRVIDTTCPSVARVQKLANQLEKEDYQVILCGEKEHP